MYFFFKLKLQFVNKILNKWIYCLHRIFFFFTWSKNKYFIDIFEYSQNDQNLLRHLWAITHAFTPHTQPHICKRVASGKYCSRAVDACLVWSKKLWNCKKENKQDKCRKYLWNEVIYVIQCWFIPLRAQVLLIYDSNSCIRNCLYKAKQNQSCAWSMKHEVYSIHTLT